MNEENMVDWQGHMTEPQHRQRILLSEVTIWRRQRQMGLLFEKNV
jgi:hypothetical protein